MYHDDDWYSQYKDAKMNWEEEKPKHQTTISSSIVRDLFYALYIASKQIPEDINIDYTDFIHLCERVLYQHPEPSVKRMAFDLLKVLTSHD